MIPESVPSVVSVTTKRGEVLNTPLGEFLFRHVARCRFFGYSEVEVARGQHVFVATPEKALLDLVYLTTGGSRIAYLRELRLQNLEIVDKKRLAETASLFGMPRLDRAARNLIRLMEEEEGYEAS